MKYPQRFQRYLNHSRTIAATASRDLPIIPLKPTSITPARFPSLLAAAWAVLLAICPQGNAKAASLEDAFSNPPDRVKPSVWWFWGESVTTKQGITHDLEALKRTGFGGVVVYEQLFTDRPGALKSLSPEWLSCFRHAAGECARLGLSLEVNVGNGYCAGGPWITPELGMQRLVYSEVSVARGKSDVVRLPHPPAKLGYYKDVAVLAWPARSGCTALTPKPSLTSQPEGIDLDTLFHSASEKRVAIKPGADGRCIIRMEYPEPFTVRSLTYSMHPGSKALVIATQMPGNWSDDFLGQGMNPIAPIGELEASDDGNQWRAVCILPGLGTQHDYWSQQTVAFPATAARYFRLNLHGWNRYKAYKDDTLLMGPVELHGEARIDHWESKSGNVVDYADPDRTPAYSGGEVIDPSSVIDLTGRMDADGKLNWNVPPGQWTVMRFGHTPTGARTKHGRPEGMGLECDKLSSVATNVQFDHYVGVLLNEVHKVPGARLAGINIDSAEHGSQNWTADFSKQFKQRRGYDILPYLPAMTGRVVGGSLQSDKFLHDVRRTIADLMSERYYGTFQQRCHAKGMTEMAQAPGIATCLPSDNIQAKGRTDMPMGEFWMSQPHGTMDCKEAASASHVYGLPVAAAESFTGSRADVYPEMMKPFADAALALGINRFVVLAYVHQPWDDKKPGVTQDRFYVPYQRHNTWWEYGTGFWNTLSRSCLLLREGRPAADILYHLGSETPLKITTNRMRPVPPAGYDYDICNDEILITRLTAKDGRLLLPDGTSYRLLVLSGGPRMTVAAARKVKELVAAGASVLGTVPWTGAPGLSDGSAGDAVVRSLAETLWGSSAPPKEGSHKLGGGTFLWCRDPGAALKILGTSPDVTLPTGENGTDLVWIHRRDDHADYYFIANHLKREMNFDARFRVAGNPPELWNPQTGGIRAANGWRREGDETVVPLRLESLDSLFVVFREKSSFKPQPLWRSVSSTEVRGPWQVGFDHGWGAPERATFDHLTSWPEQADEGIRHYSGTAVYSKEVDLPARSPCEHLELDLGDVAVVASVTLNGVNLGVCWKAPWRFDISGAAHAGKNRLEISVANLWVNRLIADAGLPENKRLSWATYNPCGPHDALLSSGLLGPVTIRRLQAAPSP